MTLLSSNAGLFAVVAGIFGLTVGSFLNVVIYRLPVMMKNWGREYCRILAAEDASTETTGEEAPIEPFDLIRPRSRCPSCNTPIKSLHNIPVVSYLVLAGKCAHCKTSIPGRYPMIEALTAIVSALIAWRFGFTLECAGALGLAWSLIALTFIDLDHMELPDVITLPLLWFGLFFNLIGDPAGSRLFVGPEAAIVGAIGGYLSLWSVYWGFKLVTGKEGMGHGDFKLLAALGAWLGWQALPLIIILSALVGLIFAVGMILFRGHDRKKPIPYGPYLAIAGFVALMWGPELIFAYKGFSGL